MTWFPGLQDFLRSFVKAYFFSLWVDLIFFVIPGSALSLLATVSCEIKFSKMFIILPGTQNAIWTSWRRSEDDFLTFCIRWIYVLCAGDSFIKYQHVLINLKITKGLAQSNKSMASLIRAIRASSLYQKNLSYGRE